MRSSLARAAIASAAGFFIIASCGSTNDQSNLSDPPSNRDRYEDAGTRLVRYSPVEQPPTSDWSDIARVDGRLSAPDFATYDDIDQLIGMSETIVVGSVTGVFGPYEVKRADDPNESLDTADGIFWVDVKIDQVVAGASLEQGETLTHAVSVLIDRESRAVLQFEEDPIPTMGENLVFFVREFSEFDGLRIASIAGVGSGRVQLSELQQAFGVADEKALAARSEGKLGVIAAANRAANQRQGSGTETTVPASD